MKEQENMSPMHNFGSFWFNVGPFWSYFRMQNDTVHLISIQNHIWVLRSLVSTRMLLGRKPNRFTFPQHYSLFTKRNDKTHYILVLRGAIMLHYIVRGVNCYCLEKMTKREEGRGENKTDGCRSRCVTRIPGQSWDTSTLSKHRRGMETRTVPVIGG